MKVFFNSLLILCFFSATAQSNLNETMKQQIIKDWQRAKAYTLEYLDAMPADRYSFRPVDSIRSFAEQMLHLSFATVGLITLGSGVRDTSLLKALMTPNFEKSPAHQSKDSVAYYVNASYDFVIKALNNMDFNSLSEIVAQQTPGGNRSETRLAWLLKAFEHQTHHRGQCTIYIRLVGIRPPAEKLF